MNIETCVAEIRGAMSVMATIHRSGELDAINVASIVDFVEARCAEISAAAAPASTVTLPILTLHDVAREGRAAPARQAAGRRHLQLVTGSGDAA